MKSKWCTNPNHEDDMDFDYFPDNTCDCGIGKHHYHCGICKGVTQIG